MILTKVTQKTSKSWDHSQIGHRSEYSIERLLAFRDYYERTSKVRAFLVCAITPIPALLVVLAIDCIPLKVPADGWRANYAAWVRLFIMMAAISLGLIEQIRDVIIRGTITNAGAVKVALGTASCYVAVSIAVAAAWTFPIPFGLVLMVWPYVIIFSSWTVLRVLLQSSLLRQQIKAQLLIVATQGVVAMAYPLFSAVFNRLTGFEQSVFVMVMPLIKFFHETNHRSRSPEPPRARGSNRRLLRGCLQRLLRRNLHAVGDICPYDFTFCRGRQLPPYRCYSDDLPTNAR